MPLDPSILAQGKPFQTPDPLQNYAKVLQIQGAQTQQQVSQMQLAEMKQDREEMQKIQQERIAQGQDPDLRKLAASMLNTKQYFKDGVELLQKLDAQDRFAAVSAQFAAPGMGEPPSTAPVNALAPSAGTPPVAANAPVNALRGRIPLPAPGGGGAMPAGMPSGAPPGTPMRPAMVSPGAAPMAGAGAVSAIPPQAELLLKQITAYRNLGTPQGESMAKSLEARLPFYQVPAGTAEKLVIDKANLDLSQRKFERESKTEERKAALEDRKQILSEEKQAREADPVFQQQMAQAKAFGEAIAKGDATAVQQLPKVISTAEQAISSIDAMIGKRDAKGNLLKGQTVHPGFETSVGASLTPGARFMPGTSAADFQTYFDQVKGTAFLQAYETLKGGGAITQIEGTKAEGALNRMSTAQSEPEFIKAANEFKQIVETGVTRLKAKVSSIGGTAPAIPAAAPAGGFKFLGFEK